MQETTLQYNIFDLGFNQYLSRGSSALESSIEQIIDDLPMPSIMGSGFIEIPPSQIGSGEIGENLTMVAGLFQSANFVTGVSGWQFDALGNLEANNGFFRGDITGASGTFSGTLIGGSLAIPNLVTANSFHIDNTGNAWWGATVIGSALAKILNTGAATFTNITITGTASLVLGSGANIITLNDTEGIYLGNATFASAPFSVSLAGAIKATSGEIAGWALSTTALSTGAFDTLNKMYFGTSGLSLSNVFKVTNAGVLSAVSGTIGGCALAVTSIGSTTFVSGPLGSGWNISNTGIAEFQNCTIRGTIRTSVFEKDTISCVNGMVLVSSADVLSADMTALDASTLTISGETTFSANEVIRIKDGTYDEWMLVTNAASAPTYTVTRDLAGAYGTNTNPIWKRGTAVVSMGVGTGTKTGYILLDSSSANSPFIDIYGRNSNTYSDTTLHGRFGWLKGITDADVGLATTDVWGLYTDNAYIKGVVVANTGYIGGTTGWVISAGYIKDVAGVTGMSSVVTVGDDIRFWAGHATPASAPFYVTESGALVATLATITGAITAISGAIGGWTINTAAINLDGATDALSAGMAPADYPFYAGKKYADRATAPFRVTPAGVLFANGATISGDIKVDSLSFSKQIMMPAFESIDAYNKIEEGVGASVLLESFGKVATIPGSTNDNRAVMSVANSSTPWYTEKDPFFQIWVSDSGDEVSDIGVSLGMESPFDTDNGGFGIEWIEADDKTYGFYNTYYSAAWHRVRVELKTGAPYGEIWRGEFNHTTQIIMFYINGVYVASIDMSAHYYEDDDDFYIAMGAKQKSSYADSAVFWMNAIWGQNL